MASITYKAYWGDVPQNFGDVLNRNLLEYCGVSFNHTNVHENGNLFTIGSIIRLAKSGSIVLGSGIIKSTEEFHEKDISSITYRFARGPLTRNRIIEQGGECPEIYGDPALLLPRFCEPEEKKHKIGFVPHYWHLNSATANLAKLNNWHLINVVNKDPLAVAKEISSCEKIVSTSLHGIIAAHAYGIPAKHYKYIQRSLYGDGAKFKDYYASVGLEDNDDYQIGTLPDLDLIENIIREYSEK